MPNDFGALVGVSKTTSLSRRVFHPHRMTDTRFLLILICLFVGLPSWVLAQTTPDTDTASPKAPGPNVGTADGALIADGKTIPLRYAYAVTVDDIEDAGLLLAGPRNYMVIVLSDRPLPVEAVESRDAPYGEIRSPADQFSPPKDKTFAAIHGVMLKWDTAKNAVFAAQVLYPGVFPAFTVSGTEYTDRITGLTQANGKLSGTAFVPKAVETGSESATDGPKKYQYRVSFQAPLWSEPAVTNQWEGAAAVKNPPALALRAYCTAAKQGDLATMKTLTAAPNQAYLKNPDYIKSLKHMDLSLLPKQVRRVVVRGGTATIMIVSEKPNYSQVAIQLVQVSGAWKLYWP